MGRAIRIVAMLALIAIGAWYGWRWLVPDDEAEIRAVLERIADAVTATPGGDTGRLVRAASLSREFDPEVAIDAGPPFQRLRGRDAVIGTAARLNAAVRDLQITFRDVTIHVDPARQEATANLVAQAQFDDGGGAGFDARELDVTFRRLGDAWVVSAVTLVPPLRRIDQQ